MHLPTVLSLFTLLVAACECCPFPCICRWKNGKQATECVNKDLLIIPEGLDSTTQVLEFSGNNLRTLHREKFLQLDLINLQRIHLASCRIDVISDEAFKGLTNLVELDLSENLLEVVPSAAFRECPSLMRLILTRNPIKSLERGAFNYLSFLNTLELSGCEISRVDADAFQGLYSLEWLHLESNKMRIFPASQHLPPTLKGVQLQDNPWQCDCHLLEFREFLLQFSFPLSIEPLCASPRGLSGRKIKSLPGDMLACLPEVQPTTFFLEIDQGKNISLVCQVEAIPEAAVSWYFEGQLLRNDTFPAPGLRLLYFLEKGTVNKRSELYLYNANSDDSGTFVCNAENTAGNSHANFTIRVLLKQEASLDASDISIEFILIVTFATSLSVLLLLVAAVFSALKCRRYSRMRKKRHDSKVALGNYSTDNSLKDSVDESLHRSAINYQEIKCRDLVHTNRGEAMTLATIDQQPMSLKYYQEQDPDLIDGTEKSDVSLRRHKSILRSVRFDYVSDNDASECGMFVVPGDVRVHQGQNYYKTLPNKRRTAAAPAGRVSREAEFITRSTSNQPQQVYDFFGSDIRHTADGYPARTTDKCLQAVIVPMEDETQLSVSTSVAGTCMENVQMD